MIYLGYPLIGLLTMCLVWVVVKMIGIQVEIAVSKHADRIIAAIKEEK